MWRIGDVEAGFPIERGQKEVSAGRREIGALQEHIFSEVRAPPHLHLSGGFPGYGSDVVVPVWSWNSALREARLYALSSLWK